MKKLDASIPSTTDGLHELMIRIKTENAFTGYLLEDVYAAAPISPYTDIAQAYGLTVGSSKYRPLHYDETTKSFFDEAASSNMAKFLNYMKTLKQMDLIASDYLGENYRLYDINQLFQTDSFL